MDGNLYKRKDRKNGGRFTVCLSSRDESILYKFEEMFGDICKIKKFSKQTNFTKNKKVDFTAFVICNLHFVDESVCFLKRNENSIKMRLYRIKKAAEE